LLAVLEDFSRQTAVEVARWPSTTDVSLTPATRRRLEAILARASSGAGAG
jgi:hypothetical protein